MGVRFAIEDRYARLVGMVLVIITYSSTMPALYIAGIILCFVLFWVDKFMLIYFYKNPSYMRME
jgi:hypothetical protein